MPSEMTGDDSARGVISTAGAEPDGERDPAAVEVTQLSNVLVAPTREDLDRRVEALAPANATAEEVLDRTTGGLADDHVGRFRLLSEAGVDAVVVSLADIAHPGAIENFKPVIDAFR